MRLDRALGDAEATCDLLVGEPLSHQDQHLALARGQVRGGHPRRTPCPEQLTGRARVDRRLTAGYCADAAQDLVGLGVLEQIAHRAGVEGAHDPLRIGVRREHQHVRQLLPDDGPGRTDAVDARHLQVHEHHVGTELAHHVDRLLA